LPLGTEVILGDKVVSTSQSATSDVFYVQEPNGSAGIRVVPPPAGTPAVLQPRDIVDVTGMLALEGAELCVQAQTVTLRDGLAAVRVVGLANRSVGGGTFGSQPGIEGAAGLNNVGLMVKLWGRVTSVSPGVCVIRDGSVFTDGDQRLCDVRVKLPIGTSAPEEPDAGELGPFVVVTGTSGTWVSEESIKPEIRPRYAADLCLVLPDLKVTSVAQDSATIEWNSQTAYTGRVELIGVIPPFREPLSPASFVQGICYSPQETADQKGTLTTDLIDQDLNYIRMANANTVNLYDLGPGVLDTPVHEGSPTTLRDYVFQRCVELRLKVIARLESYPKQCNGEQWTFSFDVKSPPGNPHRDAEWVLARYAATVAAFKDRYKDLLLYYLVNMPLDDPEVQDELGGPFCYPTAAQQRSYVEYLRGRIAEVHPGATVRVMQFYSVDDTVPAAPVADLVNGIALMSYPGRCRTHPFTTGLDSADCGTSAQPGDGPSMEDGLNVVIGKDQIDYWVEKARLANGLADKLGLAMDGVGFPDQLCHWSGVVADRLTKVQAIRCFADLLRQENLTDGYSYFALHNKKRECDIPPEEGSFGIVAPSMAADEAEARREHTVTFTGLWPGTRYAATVVRNGWRSQPVYFETTHSCVSPDWPRLTITNPGYGGDLADGSGRYTVRWSSRYLPAGANVSLFADSDDRGLDGTCLGVFDATAGSAEVNLSTVPQGRYFIYGRIDGLSHCAVRHKSPPDELNGVLWDYSPGQVAVRPTGTVQACRTNETIAVDGKDDEPAWKKGVETIFATHPLPNGSTQARVKFLWDLDNLYAFFDVDDTQVETDVCEPWNGDSVSAWLAAWRWGTMPEVKESRMGPCEGGSSNPLGEAVCRLKEPGTCNNAQDTDTGFSVEMRIPWSQLYLMPASGAVMPLDLLSVDHDLNPTKPWNDPVTVWSKLFWDGEGSNELRGALLLAQ